MPETVYISEGRKYKLSKDPIDFNEDSLLASIEMKERTFKQSKQSRQSGASERIALPDDPFSENDSSEKRLLSSKPRMVFTDDI